MKHSLGVGLTWIAVFATAVCLDGATLHQCGGAYYQPYGNQYVVVNVQ